MATDVENVQVTSRPNAPQRIIAVAIVFAFLYWASSVVIAVILAALIAYFLDPMVKSLERVRVPRSLGALLVLLLTTAIFVGAVYSVIGSAQVFANDWPRYSFILRHLVTSLDAKLASFERQMSQIEPDQNPVGGVAVRVENPDTVRSVAVSAFESLGSYYSVMLVGGFLPFLVFFMLAGKQKIWRTTLDFFPQQHRVSAGEAFDEVGATLRRFVAGTGLVALILVMAHWIFFALMGLDFPFLVALVSGLLNLIPYIGAPLAWVPPILIGMGQWNTPGHFILVAAVLTLFHITAANVLMPSIVGRRVRLNALAVTLSLLFWGWLWGGFGLVLAVPITATIKIVCDHVPSWQPLGRWLSA